MTETHTDGLSARLWRLPGQLLLALVNATAVLVIIAVILVLIAAARIEHLAGDITATMTDAVLTRLDVDPKRALTGLDRLNAEVSSLTDALRSTTANSEVLDRQMSELNQQLAGVQASIDRLGETRTRLVNQAISTFAAQIADSLDCRDDRPEDDGVS